MAHPPPVRLDRPVAIVGAGPVGLTTALGLAFHGIPFVVFEDDDSLSLDTKAGTTLPRTLEIWQRYGVADAILAKALRVDEIGEIERATGRQLEGRRLCTVRLARKLLPQLWSRRLDYLAMHYGVSIRARHRAGGDAEATAEILVRLLRDARSRECHCWPDLEALLGRMLVRTRRRRRSAMPRPVDRDTTA